MAWRIYLSPPDVGPRERELLLEAFDSGWIAPLGPHVDAFEAALAERAGRAHAVALSSGTAALHLALLELGAGPGDEVLCSTLTFAATTNAVRYTGAMPVLVDAEPARWNMDPRLLAAELERLASQDRLPRAIVPVDLYGTMADHDAICAVADRYEVPVLADAAESLGASDAGRPSGHAGTAAVFSFNGNKIMTTSGGGALVTDDSDLAARVTYLATQARQPAPHYEHTEVGYNYRLSNLLAAVGRAQLERLDDLVARRREINARYRDGFADLDGISTHPTHEGSTRWLTQILLDPTSTPTTPTQLREALAEREIESRPVWKPMHLQPSHGDCRAVGGEVAEDLFARGLCLPSGSVMRDAEVDEVIEIVRRTYVAA